LAAVFDRLELYGSADSGPGGDAGGGPEFDWEGSAPEVMAVFIIIINITFY
jgi:hypothetical protein